MRRFDSDALLSRHPEIVRGDLAEHLGRRIARYHAAAAPLPQVDGAASLAYSLDGNARELRHFAAILGEDIVDALLVELRAGFEAAAPLLDRRFRSGFGRRCHGDLHLKNIFLQGGVPVLFDCIEFDDRLSDIDVLYDLAFLLMDLEVRQQREGANRVLNGYLDEAARGLPEEMWEGLRLLPLFLAMRAGVRAHVSARMKEAEEARRYAEAARGFLAAKKPVLAAVGGLSGSGKSWFARVLAPLLGLAPGAVVLRSDEIRKRLWNVAPTVRLAPEAYSQQASAHVYAQMMKEAEAVLRSGHAVVLDAVFLKEAEREKCAALAERCGVRFAGVWLDAPGDVLRQRIGARSGDASDANVAVLEEQLARDPGPIAWRKLSATGDLTLHAPALAQHLS
jgi:predicted kinase